MAKMKGAFIGYLKQDDPAYWDNLKVLAELGYQGVESAGGLLQAPGGLDNIKRLRDLGLEPLTSATSIEVLETDGIAPAVKAARDLGVDRVSVYGSCILKGNHNIHVTYEDFMHDVEVLAKAATQLKSEGLVLRYHNHSPEFLSVFNGLTAFEVLLRAAEDLQILLDVGWVAVANVDPVRVIRNWAERIDALHLKDFQDAPLRTAWGVPYHNAFTAVGSGVVNIRGCLQAGCDVGLTWGIMEQDTMNTLSPLDSLRVSYGNCKEYGLME
ncbi:MAG: sugar phosphate isomerase/epimerase [Eubacteriales bacterium]|nr:sugar phosphate isomerase/epimerase [Eubacteriales bacterium]